VNKNREGHIIVRGGMIDRDEEVSRRGAENAENGSIVQSKSLCELRASA
jgi:hypothetical protein